MIIVYYFYKDKNGHWSPAEKVFESVTLASRFCYAMKRNPKLTLDGWECDFPDDNEEMQRRVNIAKINGWRI